MSSDRTSPGMSAGQNWMSPLFAFLRLPHPGTLNVDGEQRGFYFQEASMSEERAVYRAGTLSNDKQCKTCGDAVSIDVRGNCLCYTCGRFVDAVPTGTVYQFQKGTDVQMPLFKNGWGIPS